MLMSSSFEPLRLLLRDRASTTCLLLEGGTSSNRCIPETIPRSAICDSLFPCLRFAERLRTDWMTRIIRSFREPKVFNETGVYDFDRGLYECSGEFVSIILNVTMIYLIFTTIGKQTISFWKGNNFFFFFLEYNQKYNSSPIIGQTSKLNGLRIKLSLV